MASSSSASNGDRCGTSKRIVEYFYEQDIGNYHFGPGHPMKPHRVRMTHNLIVSYGLYRQLRVWRPLPIDNEQLARFHAADYISFLERVTPSSVETFSKQLKRFNMQVRRAMRLRAS